MSLADGAIRSSIGPMVNAVALFGLSRAAVRLRAGNAIETRRLPAPNHKFLFDHTIVQDTCLPSRQGPALRLSLPEPELRLQEIGSTLSPCYPCRTRGKVKDA